MKTAKSAYHVFHVRFAQLKPRRMQLLVSMK